MWFFDRMFLRIGAGWCLGAGWCRFGAGVCRMVPVVSVGAGLVPGGVVWCRLVLVAPYGVGILTCFVNKSNCLLFCGQPQFVGFSLYELVLILSSVDCVGFDVVIRCVMWHNVIYVLGMYSCFEPVQGGGEVGWNGNHWVMRSLWPIGLHDCSFQDSVFNRNRFVVF